MYNIQITGEPGVVAVTLGRIFQIRWVYDMIVEDESIVTAEAMLADRIFRQKTEKRVWDGEEISRERNGCYQ